MKKLPLASPRSPAELDKKILAYAKQRAPQKRSYGLPLWVSGMATASVVAVAVMIALPQQPEQAPPITEAAVSADALSSSAARPAKAMKLQRAEKRKATPPAAMSASSATFSADEAVFEQEMAEGLSLDVLTEATVQKRLKEIAVLLKNGKRAQAEANYQALKGLCPGCELPQSLEQALEKYGVEP